MVRAKRPQPQPPRIPEHPLVVFETDEQRTSFLQHMRKKVTPTRFLSRSFLTTLGLTPILDEVFQGLGMPSLFGMGEYTYESLTLEFLSSYVYDKADDHIRFRLMNHTVNLNVASLGELFDFVRPNEGLVKAPEPFSVEFLWSLMTSEPHRDVQVSHLHTNAIEHPVLRLVLRVLTGTLFARPDISKAKCLDVEILGGFLNPLRQPEFRIDLAQVLATHFAKAASGGLRSHEIGGLVTWIAKRQFGLDDIEDYKPATTEIPWIDRAYLINNHHWVHMPSRGRYNWLVEPRRFLPLPCDNLPPLLPLSHMPDRRNVVLVRYQIPPTLAPFLPDDAPEATLPARRRQRRAFMPEPPSDPVPPPAPAQRSDIWSLSEMQYNIHLCEQQLTMYGLHTSLVRGGHIPQAGPHPAFWRGVDGYPGTIFQDRHIDPSTFIYNPGSFGRGDGAGPSGVGQSDDQPYDDDMDSDN